ncbi:uncharacterized protein [Arachis hypogaea]|uniref:uncharacterized protein n=1 Tax=Arachis hypogaea TaxID=3818 RepID=UPI003B2117C6
MCGVSDKAFRMIQELLGDAFEHAKILASLHDAKRIIKTLSIAYKKIDACPNDCMLYQGNDQELSRCKRCGTSRWKQKTRRNSIVRINVVVKKNGKSQVAKVLHYFPLIPRLQWMFMSSHRYQQDRVRFDGKVEDTGPPIKLSGGDILRQLENVHVTLGKVQMVAEKNVCDNIIYTILNDSGKSKDHLKVRKDLQLMEIRRDLWPQVDERYPTVIFSMLNSQKGVFLKTLKNVVFPDGHSSNISHCVDLHQQKLSGLKSHDNHTLMEYLLPIASRNVLPALVSVVLADFSTFFRRLCSKSIDPQQLPLLQEHVVLTLCRMEIIFHHLSLQSWYLCRLKQYVRNTAAPEGSIAEGYLSNEILTFCSRYLDNVESRINRPVHVDDRPSKDVTNNVTSMFPLIGKVVGAAAFFNLSPTERLQAHRHVLVNCTTVENFLE